MVGWGRFQEWHFFLPWFQEWHFFGFFDWSVRVFWKLGFSYIVAVGRGNHSQTFLRHKIIPEASRMHQKLDDRFWLMCYSHNQSPHFCSLWRELEALIELIFLLLYYHHAPRRTNWFPKVINHHVIKFTNLFYLHLS